MEIPPPPSRAVGTAILDEPTDNVLTMHRIDGATVRLKESEFVATPDPWVVPQIGPLKWPAVFAVEETRLWVWAESQWGWLDRGEARGTVAFVAYQPLEKRGAAQQAVAADGAAPRR